MSVRTRLVSSFAALAALPLGTAFACSGGLHIELEHAGVYALDYASIVKAEPALADCPRDTLLLTQKGKPVPIRITGDGEKLGANDHIEWLGEPLHGPQSWFDPYSTVNVYQLSASPGAHPRIVDVPAPAAGKPAELSRHLHLEEENLMIRLNQLQNKSWEQPDVWHWAKLTHIDPKPFEVKFDLPDLAARGSTVKARINLRGMSDVMPRAGVTKPDDHQVQLVLNGQSVGELKFNGRGEIANDLQLPLSALKAKDNLLELSVPKRPLSDKDKNFIVDVVMFNWLEFDYPSGGDLASSDSPLHATTPGLIGLRATGEAPVLFGSDGRRYLAAGTDGTWRYAQAGVNVELTSSATGGLLKPTFVRAMAPVRWQSPAEPIDYLMLSHKRLIDAARPLAEFHRKRGLKVALIDVDDVYDEFSHGIVNPEGIRALMSRAYNDWPKPAPRYALLVGDASFDIRHQRINRLNIAKWADNELLNGPGFGDIPSTPYEMKPTDLPHRDLIPTWQFASYDGQSASDNHFVSVGTDPMQPVIAIGRFPVVDPEEVTAIVDKTVKYMSSPRLGAWRRDVMFITDESDYFKQSSDKIAESLAAKGFLGDKVYASADEKDNVAHQSAIKDGLNEGRLLVHFIGHGGRYIWRTGPPDLRKNHDLFTLDDVSHLKNGSTLPMILSMTCYSAPFDNPTEDSIGERFLREPDRGAVAVFAASWRNSPSPQFSTAIVEALVKPGGTIGEAIVAGKKTNKDPTMVETYNLLGDPAVILERPEGELKFARSPGPFGAERIDALVNGESFRGQVAVDWIDADGKVTYSQRFSALGTRFALPQPPRAIADKALELHAYVADANRSFDAIGRLILREPPPKAKPVAQTPPVISDGTYNPNATSKSEVAPAAAKPPKPRKEGENLFSGRFEQPRAAQSGGGARRSVDSSRTGGGGTGAAPPAQSSRNALRK